MAQHIVVIALVVFCLAYVAKQAVGTFRGGKGKLGSCCAKGCSVNDPLPPGKTQFLPVDTLLRKR